MLISVSPKYSLSRTDFYKGKTRTHFHLQKNIDFKAQELQIHPNNKGEINLCSTHLGNLMHSAFFFPPTGKRDAISENVGPMKWRKGPR